MQIAIGNILTFVTRKRDREEVQILNNIIHTKLYKDLNLHKFVGLQSKRVQTDCVRKIIGEPISF